MTLQDFTHLIEHARRNPAPSYSNVIPAGPGWYIYTFRKFRIVPNYLPWPHLQSAIWFSDETLTKLAADALEALTK